MRTTHTRIIRAYFAYTRTYVRICLFVMHAPKLLYVKYCWTNKGHFWNEKARGFNAKFAYFEKRQWNESLNIPSFRSLRKFTDRLPFIDICLIVSCQKVGRKLKQSRELLILTRLFSFTEYYKVIIYVMFTLQLMAVNKSQGQRIVIVQVVLALFKWNNRLWRYIDSQLILRIVNYETTRKSFVLCTRRQITCEMFIVWRVPRPSWKNEKSGSNWHK